MKRKLIALSLLLLTIPGCMMRGEPKDMNAILKNPVVMAVIVIVCIVLAFKMGGKK